ncbi:hypothetical protein C0989_007165 [Termitomyces sp. Mn162]|nr:hypothetical protein C0989_007165 [Termitomyces sp. Mn162]
MFQAKPITFQLESSQVAFTASYLQGIAFDHYTALLWFDSNNSILSNWLAFIQEFSSLEDALDCGPDPDVFSTLATLLCAMVLTLDDLPAHLPSHSSTTLLLCTTLSFSDNSISTLVNSSATDNFINKSLVALTPHLLQCLPAPILLKLFDGDPTLTGDITHCLGTTMTFTNRQQQELQLLITKLCSSTPVILGFSWLCSTNTHINWPSLTLCLDWDNPTDSGLVPFNVSPSSENSETTINYPWTPLQLCSRSAWLFVINVQLDGSPKVISALVNNGASSTFVSSQLNLQCNNLNKPLELQLFNRSSTTTGITQYHDNTLTLDNDLQFQAWLLITQLLLLTLIVLGLPWLQNINPNIDWKNLTMQFSSPKASLAAAIPLHLQSVLDSDDSNPGTRTSRAAQSPSTSEGKENTTLPQSPLTKS